MDIQSLYQLNKAVEVLERPTTFLLNRFFGEIQDPQGKKITIDKRKRKNKIAPFVSPCVEGVPIAQNGFTTISLDPAYIRLKDAPSQCDGGKRAFGQRPDQDISSQEKLENNTMDVLSQHEDSIQQRLEWMAANALFSGSYIVESAHHPKYEVDFQRNANNTITLGTPWSTVATASPIKDLDDASKIIFKGSGSKMEDVVMDMVAYNWMMKNADVKELFQLYNGVDSSMLPTITPEAYDTVMYKGRLGTYNIWIYEASYDVDGVDTPLFPAGQVTCVAPKGLQGFVGYGEIDNDKAVEAGLAEQTRFVDRFNDDNVGKKFVQTETAPLVLPGNPDAVATFNAL